MQELTLNDWVQCLSVVVLLAICVWWIARRIYRRVKGCDSTTDATDGECTECKLSRYCKHKK